VPLKKKGLCLFLIVLISFQKQVIKFVWPYGVCLAVLLISSQPTFVLRTYAADGNYVTRKLKTNAHFILHDLCAAAG